MLSFCSYPYQRYIYYDRILLLIMKFYKKETVERDEIDKILCDLCGKEMPTEPFPDNRVVMEHHKTEGSARDGGWGKMIYLDICADCWCGVILPFLREKGLKRKYEEWG
jgi:hypothetical protein